MKTILILTYAVGCLFWERSFLVEKGKRTSWCAAYTTMYAVASECVHAPVFFESSSAHSDTHGNTESAVFSFPCRPFRFVSKTTDFKSSVIAFTQPLG